MKKRATSTSPRIWALLGTRTGDNDQVIALAEALGLSFEIRKLEYNRLHTLGPRILGRSLASLTSSSRAQLLGEAPPDLTISTGHRSVAAVRALKHISNYRMCSIHVGFPRISPRHFDLVIATSQYPMPDRPNIVRIPYALTRNALTGSEERDDRMLGRLNRPMRLLAVGGPTLYWKLDVPLLLRTLEQMLGEARTKGGSVIVLTSPRTPSHVSDQIRSIFSDSDVPNLLTEPGDVPSYASLLNAADSIQVTADSVSMISDAIWTRKPLAIVPITKSHLGRSVFYVMDCLRPGRHVYPQDLRYFWKALAEIGVNDELAHARTNGNELMHLLTDRARAIVGPLLSAASGGS